MSAELRLEARARSVAGPKSGRSGFTLVELVVAVVILAVGVLGLAGATSYMIRETTLADLRTERTAALVAGLERLTATPFDSVEAGSDKVGAYAISWTVVPQGGEVKVIRLVTEGPGLASQDGGPPTLRPNVPDTFIYNVLRP